MGMATPLSNLIKTYGKNVTVSRVNGYNIIHLDNPTEEQIKQRIKDVLDSQIDNGFEDNCPLYQEIKGQPCDIVYYKQ